MLVNIDFNETKMEIQPIQIQQTLDSTPNELLNLKEVKLNFQAANALNLVEFCHQVIKRIKKGMLTKKYEFDLQTTTWARKQAAPAPP